MPLVNGCVDDNVDQEPLSRNWFKSPESPEIAKSYYKRSNLIFIKQELLSQNINRTTMWFIYCNIQQVIKSPKFDGRYRENQYCNRIVTRSAYVYHVLYSLACNSPRSNASGSSCKTVWLTSVRRALYDVPSYWPAATRNANKMLLLLLLRWLIRWRHASDAMIPHWCGVQ